MTRRYPRSVQGAYICHYQTPDKTPYLFYFSVSEINCLSQLSTLVHTPELLPLNSQGIGLQIHRLETYWNYIYIAWFPVLQRNSGQNKTSAATPVWLGQHPTEAAGFSVPTSRVGYSRQTFQAYVLMSWKRGQNYWTSITVTSLKMGKLRLSDLLTRSGHSRANTWKKAGPRPVGREAEAALYLLKRGSA